MKILKITSLVLLAILCIPFLPMSSASTAQPLVSIETSIVKTMDPVLPSPEPPHKILPISILVYTQYADVTGIVNNEWYNTMGAINDTYGTNYYYTNLTDYTNLATELPNYDILLIPEQENNNSAGLTSIGTAWASTLTDFVTNGGIVVLMACFESGENGATSHIYNASGLMHINAINTASWGFNLNLVNTSDALARGVASTWSAADGSVTFDTTEHTSVVEDDGGDTLVVHKIIGQGHVVLLGFDLFTRDINYDQLLGNAIRLHRHIVFDESHGQGYSILNSYSDFVDDLVTEGFAVSRMGSFSTDLLDSCDVLVVSYCTSYYTAAEKVAISSFVDDGGGVFLCANWGQWGEEVDDLANALGYDLEYEIIYDTDDNEPPNNSPGQPFYDSANIQNHSLTLSVSSVQFYGGTGIISMPAEAVPIIFTDSDGTAQWGNTTPVYAMPCYVAGVHGLGRVVVAGEGNFILDDSDADNDGTVNYLDRSNNILARNTIRWLSAAGIKERIVLFDESHGPYYLVSDYYLKLANFLTCNGYTIHWMTTFHTDFLNQAHMLFICDGLTAHTSSELAAIKAFVAAGGGLFVVAAYGIYGTEADLVGNEFGIDQNNTGMLIDSDDQLAGTPHLIWYNQANFGTHPIMDGITRLELYYSSALDAIGTGIALVSTDTDDTCSWSDGGLANGVPIVAAVNHQLGRVVYSADSVFLADLDEDSDGIQGPDEHDNVLFLVNIFQWLTVNRPPAVTVTSPNGGEILEGATNSITWTASDADKDALTFDVSFSVDGGGSWTPLVTGTTSTSVNFDVTGLPEGNQYLIRVTAFDYDASTADESDAIFSIESEGPTITNVQTDPATPLASLPVTVSADIIDVSGVASAVCQVSTDGGAIWTDYAMSLTSGDTYEAVIGAYPAGAPVEYRITATDSSATARTSTTSTFSFTIAAGPPLPWWLGIVAAIIVVVIIVIILIFLLLRRKGAKTK